jgi:hypothetical protein
MNSFLGGGLDYGSDIPSYGDVGANYTGDYFNNGFGVSDLSQALLKGLSGIGGSSVDESIYYRRPTSYADETRSTMNNMLTRAIQAFGAPKAVI